MSSGITNNKRIAKNAIALYFRMIVMMLIGLYTSRVVLNALGVTDFGIYNVVGGFVSMFSLISSSIMSSISRSLTFELGRGDMERLRKTFSMSVIVLMGLGLIIVILLESIGLWYLNNKMVIPPDRLHAAHWCFQLSVITFVLGMVNMPYSSSIVSHERMDVYAYFTILDAVFKLLICYLIVHSPIDRLIMYGILLCIINFINQLIYVTFCKRNFMECKFQWVYDKSMFFSLFSFAGWNFIGCSAAVLRTQGATLLLNWAGGPAVNAANGIAGSICGVVQRFVGNFTLAFDPQITKRYAASEYDSLMKLLLYGSKYSYYLLFVLALPIMFNAHFILQIWLGVVPDHSVSFTRWIIIFMLAEAVSRPIITAKNATGQIRNYQIVVGGILLLMLPLSYLCLKLGMPVEVVPFFNAATACVAIVARMCMLNGVFPTWSSLLFVRKVLLNVLLVSVLSSILPFCAYLYFDEGWTNLIHTTILCLLSSSVVIYYIGCDKRERQMLTSKILILIDNLKSRFLHR
ncbi:MAG: lipopolysaccharide biosynthesis protein [Bacteroidaceae bacterium]